MKLEGSQNNAPKDDKEEDVNLSRRGFLKGLSAVGAVVAGEAFSVKEASAMMLEKLPKDSVLIPEEVMKKISSGETTTLWDMFSRLKEHVVPGLDRDMVNKIGDTSGPYFGLVGKWNTDQRLENKIVYYKTKDFPKEYNSYGGFNGGQIPTGKITELYFNVAAIKKFLENPNFNPNR